MLYKSSPRLMQASIGMALPFGVGNLEHGRDDMLTLCSNE